MTTGVSRVFRRFTTRDLVVIAILASLGIAIKPVVVPLAHLIAAPLFIPAGAFAGGLYMMWLVVGMGITGKRGTATLIALVQALLVLFTGVVGSHGALSLISYTAPGIVMDLGLLLIGHRVCCLGCSFLSGVLANLTGTFAVSLIFFRMPLIPLALALCTAALSGGVGGVIAWQVVKVLRRHLLGGGPGAGAAVGGPRDGGPPAAKGSTAALMVAVALVGALALAGCGGEGAGGGASSASPRPSPSPTALALVYGASGADAELSLAHVWAGEPAAATSISLAEALKRAGHAGARRVDVFAADGSITSAPLSACTLSRVGEVSVKGARAVAVTGLLLDPPRRSVRHVRVLAQKSLEAGRRSLVIYLDGFGYRQYLAANKAGIIPHLRGFRVEKAATVYPTITPVTFASMVSGEDPATTGVRSRRVHRLACPTLFTWAEAHGKSTALVEGNLQIIELTKNVTFTVDDDGDGCTDDEVLAAALQTLKVERPDFLLVHLHGVDDVAHATGPFSRASFAKIEETDAMVAKLLARWDGDVIITADHGLHAVDDPERGKGGAHGDFRSEDLLIPFLTRTAR